MKTAENKKQKAAPLPPGIAIVSVSLLECEGFFQYLNDHRSDNGKPDTGYFLPLSSTDWRMPPEKEQTFRSGLAYAVGARAWRRAWVARDAKGQILGHIDLRSHPVAFTDHRCLLGLGVDRNHRRLGIGAALLSHAIEWALANTALEWIDLEVLSTNERAIRLYLRMGFAKIGEVPDMFRTDGHVFSSTIMTKPLRAARGGDGTLDELA